jgi:two-component system, OmpR family, KDP operon response regulator KdpE
MNILIVDDDPEIRLIAGFLLRTAGHDVREADDAAAAAAACAAAVPDVVLMDVLLGAADGIAVAARLLPGLRPVPALVFLTGASRPDQLERMRDAAPAGIIGKPFDPASFVTTLMRCVEAAP